MIAFFACISFMSWLPLVFPFALAIIWFYALFDTLQKVTLFNAKIDRNHRALPLEDESLVEDAPIAEAWIGQKFTDSPIWIGGALIIFGILLMVHIIAPGLWVFLQNIHIGSIVLAIVLIGFGLWLIRNQSKGK